MSMAEVFLGVLLIFGGLGCGVLLVMSEVANPTPGQYNGPDRRPVAWLGLALTATGLSLFIFG